MGTDPVGSTVVRITTVCPGTTATEFHTRAGTSRSLLARLSMARPEAIVASALRASDRGRAVVNPGLINHLLTFSIRLTPRFLVTRISALLMRPSCPPVTIPRPDQSTILVQVSKQR